MKGDWKLHSIADEADFVRLSESSYTAVLLYLNAIRGNSDDTTNKPRNNYPPWHLRLIASLQAFT
jgi:hypothetical protein